MVLAYLLYTQFIIIFFGYFVGFLYIYFNSEIQDVDIEKVSREGSLNHIISEDDRGNIETVNI